MGEETVKQLRCGPHHVLHWLHSVPRLAWLEGAFLVAAAVRLPGLGQQSLWVDEGSTYIRAVLPLGAVLHNILEVHDQVPLYYLLLRVSTSTLGSSEYALRFPSVFFGIVSIAFVYLLGRLSGRRQVGLLAAWVAALNPFHVWYSREARMYSLGLLLASCAMWCFLLALRRGGGRRWTTLAIVSGMAYLTHYATLVLGLVQLLIFLFTFRRTYRVFRTWFLSQALAVVPAAGWLMLSMIAHGYSGIRGSWIPMPSLLAPVNTFWNFSLGYDGNFQLSTAIALLPFAIALVAGACSKRDRIWQRTVVLWLAAPPTLVIILSLVLGPSYVDRYLSPVLPAYFLLIAAGLVGLSNRPAKIGLISMLLAAMAFSTCSIIQGQRFTKPDWQAAVGRVLEGTREDDHLFVSASGFYVTFYYADHELPIERVTSAEAAETLDQALGEEGRVWLLHRSEMASNHAFVRTESPNSGGVESPELAAWLLRHANDVRREWFFDGLYLVLLERGRSRG